MKILGYSPDRRGSVARQIIVFSTLIMILLLASNTILTYQYAQKQLLSSANSQARNLNLAYFDSLNTLMLTGNMASRELLRNKFLQMPGILSLQVIRGEAVAQQFGEGLPSEQVQDKLDRQALRGEEVIQTHTIHDKRILTLILPYQATHNTRGVNCLQCHSVKSGSINGAIRIDYDLDSVVLSFYVTLSAHTIFQFRWSPHEPTCT